MELVPSKYLEDSVTDLLYSKSPAHGLALLIGCKTSFNPQHSPLDGVEGDLYLLKNTFSKLGFDTVNLLDPTREEIIKVVDLIARKFPVPMQNNTMHPSYRHIVVTFSGHGDLCQVFSKNSSLNLKEEIVNPLVNTDPVVSKLFFVDACRGDKIDPGIGYNIRDFIDGGSPGRIVARGANEIRLPSRGNYLLAFSTLPGMKSFEDNECGSFWMQLLCRALLENDGKSSILDLLTVVNQKLILKFNEMISTLQQPIFMSCLNDVIRFERTYVEVTNLEPLQPTPLSLESGVEIQSQSSPALMPEINVEVQLPHQSSVNQQGYYRSIVNLFFQRGIIQNKDGEYTQNPSNEQQYMFVIRAELKNKCTIHGRSRYLPKRQAEEEAAEHLISQIKPCLTNLKEDDMRGPSSVSLASSSSAASCTTPSPSKTAKSLLKEYCDKMWKGSQVDYDPIHDELGFVATVTLPNKLQVTGEVQMNKKEAENSAAKVMLTKLDVL